MPNPISSWVGCAYNMEHNELVPLAASLPHVMLGPWILLLASASAASAMTSLPWSSPAHYPGKPSFSYNASWQSYFEVTDALPNITFPLPRSFAGTVSTETVNFANNSAFFWGFEKTNGSLTQASSDPWGIWLAGGPGYSSIAGMLLENGPIAATPTGWALRNTSLHQLADWFWIDAPVGVGYSTVAQNGYALNEDQMATDFWSAVSNIARVFPHLRKRPLYISGESYAGRFIPYIMKAYFGMPENQRPTQLAKVACSNPALQTTDAFEQIPITRVIETYPQLIGYSTGMYDYVREQAHLCKLDLNLTYPQTGGKFNSIHIKYGQIRHRLGSGQQLSVNQPLPLGADIARRKRALDEDPEWQEEHVDLPPFNTTRTGKINKFFGCDIRDLVLTYAFNYSMPWTVLAPEFDYLDIPYTINPLKLLIHPHHWMNNNATRTALHAPHNAIWRVTILQYPWGSRPGGQDPSVAPMAFMDELAANASANGVGMLWYSGNDDALTTHFSTEVAIQNTTFGGIQGFTVPPNTTWYDDNGEFAGVIRQERNWTFAILYGAGHQTPVVRPELTQSLLRQFWIGNSSTLSNVGLVEIDATTGATKVHTAVVPSGSVVTPTMLPDGVMPGQTDILIHDNKVVTRWPQATRAVWSAHVASVLAMHTNSA